MCARFKTITGASVPASRPKSAAGATLAPSTPVGELAGIGPRRAQMLAQRAIVTVEDLLLHLPARYQDWRQPKKIGELCAGMTAVVVGTLGAVRERPMPGAPWRRLVSASLADDTGAKLSLVWFNMPSYMRERMPAGQCVAVYGRISENPEGKIEMLHPEMRADWSEGSPAEAVRPVYRLPAAMPHRLYAGLVSRALAEAAPGLKDAIPLELRRAAGVPSLAESLAYIHTPPANADLDALAGGRSPAHAALAMDELFAFELAMCTERKRAAKRAGLQLGGPPKLSAQFVERVPFTLTRAQQRALQEIGRDLESPRQMNRILIGDVGSGKTVVALWAILRAVESGAQAAMMAPTELLAEQHHRSFLGLCPHLGLKSELLSGRVTGAARAALLRDLARGRLAVVFGTQALLQKPVRVARLGLGVIDEQHRFGVFDRARLKALGARANLLMMTATPIPRSLAMTMFANLDVSILDEIPPGRTPVETSIFMEEELPAVDQIVSAEIARGHRAYYVVPLIEDDEDEEVKSVTAMAARLRAGALRHARLGTLHGRMRPLDKERVMREFRDGKIDALVSTTVVEVGIDVPQATAVVIVGAERYGLAQLHQLRGRVGRGRDPSRCCLVLSRDADEAARDRLMILARCASGANVAEADLAMRGPGDLLGARQTGAMPLKFARFISDPAMIRDAREMAERWLDSDPGLSSVASEGARVAMRKMLAAGFSLADIG